MKKRNVLVLVLGLVIALPASAQWDRWHTSTAISGVLGVASQAIQSAERKKEMEILARQKVEFEQSFHQGFRGQGELGGSTREIRGGCQAKLQVWIY